MSRTFRLSLLLIGINIFFLGELAYAQSRQATGQVKDQKGEVLPGVSVSVRGEQQFVVTDNEGRYHVSNVKNNSVLIFSLLGFEVQERTVGNRKTVNIIMRETITGLEEVVVIGYGEVDRKDLTGSVGSVNIQQMEKAPVMSFEEALAGRVAGVQVSSSEGQPGEEGISIVIRGANSLTQDNSPLFVVDGFPMEDFEASSLNPEEIASMDILKDASATAIYGARAANGVIIIETKKGQEGRPTVTFNTRTGINRITKRMEMMEPYEFVKFVQERSPSAANALYLTDGLAVEDYRNVKGFNWQDHIFQTAPAHLYSLALRGGTRQTKYSISGSINDMTGVVINSGQKRYQGRVTIDQQVNDKLKAYLSASFSSTSNHGSYASSSSSTVSSNYMYAVWAYRPLRSAIEVDEFGNVVDDEEDFLTNEYDDDESTSSLFNPLINVENIHRTRRNNTLNVNGSLNYAFNRALTLRIGGGVKQWQSKTESFYNSSTMLGNPRRLNNIRGQHGSIGFAESTTWLNENTLRWRKLLQSVAVR